MEPVTRSDASLGKRARAATSSEEQELTRKLLNCGIVAGPIYLALGIGQGVMREGFDFSRHALSLLANGSGGWIQTANFAVTGALVVAAAMGLSRALATKPRLAWWLLGAYGLAVFLAAFFRADPVDGFPPGTPEGIPAGISTTGLLHFAVGALGFAMLGLSCLAASRSLARKGMRALSRLSLVSGLVVLAGFFGGMTPSIGIAGIWVAVVAGWLWLSVVSYTVRARA